MEKTKQVFVSWEISQPIDCKLQLSTQCCARTNVGVYGLAVDFRGWQIAKSAQSPHLTTWLDIFVHICGWFFPNMIWTFRFCNFFDFVVAFARATSMESIRCISFLLHIFNSYFKTERSFYECVICLFGEWVLRIISKTLKFSRSMVLFECESMSKSVWAVINYGFECAYFMSVIQENEDLYLVAHTSHTHSH